MVTQHATHHGLGDSSMLERIDALFACGAGEHINIPQIVVVGDQSSGKSSVLSGLIRKDLPRDSGLCTRFATKIVFRRAAQTGIRVTILPDDNAGTEHRAEIAAWGELSLDSFDDLAFGEVMREVQEVIGVAGPNEARNSKPTFSGDVLQLEISGPNEEHLSVIDVPGIFRDATPGLTTREDIEMVRNMVLRYMENPRSVMLTVVPANVDVATQEILQLASDLDPNGDRTLGVLTKPDLVDKGAESRVVDLVEGRARKIKLGWHILRNPGQQDLAKPSFDRHRQEAEFFRNNSPWNNLDAENKGIEALRNRLKDILSGLVRREFANVKLDVQKRLTAAEKELKDLGPERNSRAAQAAFLTEISTKFQHLVDLALSANFGTDGLFDEHEVLKIAPAVVLRIEQFNKDMTQFGHIYSFKAEKQHEDGASRLRPEIGKIKPERISVSEVPPSQLHVRKQAEGSDLDDLLLAPVTLSRSSGEQTDRWLRKLHKRNRGFELGTFDPVILASAMRKQTKNWEYISSGFVSDVASIVHQFTTTALTCLCHDQRIRDDLYNSIFDDLKLRTVKAIEQVDFVLAVELNGIPMTQNDSFIDQLEESRQARFIANLQDLAIEDEHHGPVVRLSELTLKHPMSNDQYLVRDIHDILQSYYEVARKRFVDNVCKQAADWFLITGPQTPLRVFSPIFVSQMSDEQLERIAKEDPKAQRQRVKLVDSIESLRRAKQVLA